ncbi:hypothetical protein AQS8620_00614 [Aquimixticola soesokkakensis]|uniref:Uncharacterized protein n=1 Tax=Aquimixticola soesokkakensis TaxID=1519096 RepID=A0A1Y5RPT7_9RHOB|nr:hypothetical protein AQS8620_00614 [Aquimixticola soesokkakensis]
MARLEGVTIRDATPEDLVALEPAFAAGRAVYVNSAPENAAYLSAIEAALAAQ